MSVTILNRQPRVVVVKQTNGVVKVIKQVFTAVVSVNGKTGAVVLDAVDVGADPSGTATTAMAAHVGASDPHPQYTTAAELAAALVAALVDSTITGTLKVRQPGGTAGTDEVQISHDGTRFIFRNPDGGGWRFLHGPSSLQIWSFDGNDTTDINGYLRVLRVQANNGIAFGGTSLSPQLDAGANGVVRVKQANNNPGTFASLPLTWNISGTVNNDNPGVAFAYELNGTSTPIVTGIGIGQVNGQWAEAWNTNATSVTFKHNDGGSTAANRLLCTGGADIVLAQYEVALLRYSSTLSRWLMRKI